MPLFLIWKTFIIRATVLLRVMCTLLGCCQFLPLSLFFSSLTIIMTKHDFVFIHPTCRLFWGSWFYRLIVLFSASLGAFWPLFIQTYITPFSSYSGTLFLDTRPLWHHFTSNWDCVYLKKKVFLCSSNWFLSLVFLSFLLQFPHTVHPIW